MTIQPLPDGYYAVPDPDDPSTTTCWLAALAADDIDNEGV